MDNENKIMINENGKIKKRKDILEENSTLMKDSNLNLHKKRVPNIIYTNEKQSDVTYLMMDDCSVNIGMYLKIIIIFI